MTAQERAKSPAKPFGPTPHRITIRMSNYAPTSPLTSDLRRSSLDLRSGTLPGATHNGVMNGNGVPTPMAPHSRASSGAYPMPTRDYAGTGGFTGARSPPKAKSMNINTSSHHRAALTFWQAHPTSLASFIHSAHVRQARRANSHTTSIL